MKLLRTFLESDFMIIVIRKSNILLVILAFILALLVYSIDFSKNPDVPVVTNPYMDGELSVLIDPGHGGEDPGAISDYSGLKEKDLNLDISFKLKALLENENVKVIMTRQDDILQYNPGTSGISNKRAQDLRNRKKMMDTAGADIVVSIHFNKFQQTQYYGAQVFYPPECPDGKKLAEFIQSELRATVDPANKREALVKKDGLIIIKNWKTPTVIVECGFLSNKNEELKIRDEQYRLKIAVAIKDGIMKYFKDKSGASFEDHVASIIEP